MIENIVCDEPMIGDALDMFTSEVVTITQIEVYEKVPKLWRNRKKSAT